MRIWVAACVAAAGLVAMGCGREGVNPAPTPTPNWGAQVDALANSALAHQHLAGLSIAVARDGQVLYAQGYGYRNVAKRLPATTHTIYNIASMTKQFTAACVMLLDQEGKLSVDDPISKFLPGFPHGDEITIRELLNHTSGLADYLDLMDPNHLSIPGIVATVEKAPLRFKPGTRYEYSNSNYVLAGVIVGKAAKMPFDEFLTTRIIRPLGLHSTSIGTTPVDMPDGALGYTVINGKIVETPPQGVNILDFPDGGVNTTVLDLVKWDTALDGGRVVDPAHLKMMMTPGPHGPETTYDYGFGLDIDSAYGQREISHTGGWTGYSGENVTFPDQRFVIIMLSNSDGFNQEYLAREIYAIFEHPSLAEHAIELSSRPGENPQHTQLAQIVLAQLAAGRLDPAKLTPALRRRMTSAQTEELTSMLAGYGRLQRMIFLGRESTPSVASEYYRLFYPNAVVSYTVEVGPDGRLSDVEFSRED
jgi:CubicO group peptidase (beta-lactamase class C family)